MKLDQRNQARGALDQLRTELLDQRTAEGHWVGELSPSALSTATAVSAVSAVLLSDCCDADDELYRNGVVRGVEYLAGQQNGDGGFGDTDRSRSNIATSFLVRAASELAGRAVGQSLSPRSIEQLDAYISQAGAVDGLRRRYGTDKTFVVPILTNMAIAGLVPWEDVARLPFEAAVFPQSMYRFLQIPVVSYAIPALVAIGQARHFLGRRALFPIRMSRAAAVNRTMKVLRRIQPDSGGYLEATPLTAFVVMSLAATNRGDHEVSRNGLRFLMDSMSEDGSWPIDTNLATWVTSLSIHALSCDPDDDGAWCNASLVDWHLGCQHSERHAFTGAEPGGWGWSDLSGAVPDSDDTPAAIIAARAYSRWLPAAQQSLLNRCMEQGVGWLWRLQNRDGGWPTFCRGWGKLPFDRSSNDLTAHALRAILGGGADDSGGPPEDAMGHQAAIRKAKRFLESNQRDDGAWLPLWFGNQDLPDETNPVYGTSRVLVASQTGLLSDRSIARGCDFLIQSQNKDGGWGGGDSVNDWMCQSVSKMSGPITSTVEETALAIDALATVLICRGNAVISNGSEVITQSSAADYAAQPKAPGEFRSRIESAGGGNLAYHQAIIRGIDFLIRSVEEERHRVPWPIGFYFAKLWYHERLYPLIFATTALGKYLQWADKCEAEPVSRRDESITSES